MNDMTEAADYLRCGTCRRPTFFDGEKFLHWAPQIDRDHEATGPKLEEEEVPCSMYGSR